MQSMHISDDVEIFVDGCHAAAVIAEGNCMEPDIHNGDTLLLDTSGELQPGDIVVFRYEGKQYCKVFFPQGDGSSIIMQPNDLRNYQPMFVQACDIVLLGRVTQVIHTLKRSPAPVQQPGKELSFRTGSKGNAVPVWCRS